MSNEIQYEVINKEHPEIVSAVKEMQMGLNVQTAVTAIGHIEFTTDGQGNLLNDTYAIRQVGTQLTPNDDGVVTDAGVEVPVAHDVAVGIINGEVNPDTVVVPTEEVVTPVEEVPVV